MSVGEVAGTERRCETCGLSDTEMMASFKGCRRLTGTWEPAYLSCTVHTGMPHAKSPDLVAQETPHWSLPSSTTPGSHSLWTSAHGPSGVWPGGGAREMGGPGEGKDLAVRLGAGVWPVRDAVGGADTGAGL